MGKLSVALISYYNYLGKKKSSDKPVGNMTATSHDDARTKAENLADARLKKIAKAAIKLNDEFYEHYFTRLSYEDEVGGRLRQRAYNTIHQADTDSAVPLDQIPKPENRSFFELGDYYILKLFRNDSPEGLKKEELSKFAKQEFSNKTKIENFYTIMPNAEKGTTINKNITVYKAILDSTIYNSIKDNDGNFDGLTLEKFEIPNEYSKFIEKFRKGKEGFSESEAVKYEEILKALETRNAYNKAQQKGSATTVNKEDIDLFDLSNDGFLNRGDISAMELFFEMKKNPKLTEKLSNTQKEDWDNYDKLKSISDIKNDKQLRNTFDFNGDGNVNGNDYTLFKKIIQNSDKFDLDGNKITDATEKELLKEYFQAILQRVSNTEEYRTNVENIMGGKKQLNYLQNKLSH